MKDENIGKKYGKLTCLKYVKTGKYKEKYYLFKCECGNEKIINLSNVRQGKTKSCGCLYKTSNQRFKKFNKYEICGDVTKLYASNTKSEFYIDTSDLEKVKGRCWHESNNGYIFDSYKNALHRVVMNCGEKEEDLVVDHINHNVKDNRKSNLRLCPQRINALNRAILPKGIATIKRPNNTYYSVQLLGRYCGTFKTLEEAQQKRKEIIDTYYKPLRQDRRNYL